MDNSNNSIIFSIFVGVTSGVITSIFVWIIVKLFNNTFIPWYQNLVYKGQRISGDWEGFSEIKTKTGLKTKCTTIVSIKQKGHLIEGEMVLIRQPNGNTCNKKYEIKGIFHDNCLVMTYEVSDNTRFGLGACVFRLVNDGKKLDGEWTAIDASSSIVFSKKEHWLRKSR